MLMCVCPGRPLIVSTEGVGEACSGSEVSVLTYTQEVPATRFRMIALVALAAVLAAGLSTGIASNVSAAPAGTQPATVTTTTQHTAPCPPPSTDMCTITETHTVTKTIRFVATKRASTSGSTPYSIVGCKSGYGTTLNQVSDASKVVTYWTVAISWKFEYSNCGPNYVTTTYFDHWCTANGAFGVACTSDSNVGVNGPYNCGTSGVECYVASADFYGHYGFGNGWSAFLRTQGYVDGTETTDNHISA